MSNSNSKDWSPDRTTTKSTKPRQMIFHLINNLNLKAQTTPTRWQVWPGNLHGPKFDAQITEMLLYKSGAWLTCLYEKIQPII
jgi:hypothetical protein